MSKQNFSHNGASRPGRHQQSELARNAQLQNELIARNQRHSREHTEAKKQSVASVTPISTVASMAKSTSALRDNLTGKVSDGMQGAKKSLGRVSKRFSGVVRSTGTTLSSAGRSVVDTVKANPIPVALTGVGLAWLTINMMSKRRA